MSERILLRFRPQRSTLTLLAPILVALAPKCPICFLAYFGIFGVAVTTDSAYRNWLPFVAAIWLTLSVMTLALPIKEFRHGPLLLGILAAVGVFAGKFLFDNSMLVTTGIILLLISTIWRSWYRKPLASAACQRCE